MKTEKYAMKVNEVNSNVELESRRYYSEEELVELFGLGKKNTPIKQADPYRVLQNIEMRKSGAHPVRFDDGYTVEIDPTIAGRINSWVARREPKDKKSAESMVTSWEGFQKIAKMLGIDNKLPKPTSVENADADIEQIMKLAGVSTLTPVQPIVAESKDQCKDGQYFCKSSGMCKPIPDGYHVMPDGNLMSDDEMHEAVPQMNKYGISAVHKNGKFYAFRNGKMVGGPFDSIEELSAFQTKSIENESYDMTPGGQVEYDFTKADFLANEDENMHTENAMELVAKFGTEQEIKRMEMIMTAHNTRGHIEPAEQEERDSYVRKYYPMLEVASPEEQETPSNVALDTLRKIVTDKQNMPVKFADGQMKVDLYSASAITKVFDKVNPANQKKMIDMMGTKEGFYKLTNAVFGMLNKQNKGATEGKSPHKKGTAKYKKHMAAMHANEDFDSTHPDFPKATKFKSEKDHVMDIMRKHPQAYAQLKASDGDMMEIYDTELYMDLFQYFSEEGMPYGTQKARDGDPVEYMNDELDSLGIFEGTVKIDSEMAKRIEEYGKAISQKLMGHAGSHDDDEFTDKQIKMAFGILNDPKFKGGNYSGAVEVINKVAPGLADHPSVANALKRANEACGAEHSPKKKKTENVLNTLQNTKRTKQAMVQSDNTEMEGYAILPSIDREKYQERDGLEGPIMTRSGKVVYYDNVEGKYYDPDTDMYMTYDEWKAYDPELPIKDSSMDKMTVTLADKKANTPAYQNFMKGDDRYVADPELAKMLDADKKEKLAASQDNEIDRLKHLSGL